MVEVVSELVLAIHVIQESALAKVSHRLGQVASVFGHISEAAMGLTTESRFMDMAGPWPSRERVDTLHPPWTMRPGYASCQRSGVPPRRGCTRQHGQGIDMASSGLDRLK